MATPDERRAATERSVPATQTPSRTLSTPGPRGTAAPAAGPMPIPRMQAPRAVPAPLRLEPGSPSKPPPSISTPALVVVGTAGAVPALPVSINSGALTVTGLGDKPIPKLPASIATPGLQVSGLAP